MWAFYPMPKQDMNYKKKLESSLVAQQVRDLALSLSGLGCCCGMVSIPGPGTSTCHKCGKKKKKKERSWYHQEKVKRLISKISTIKAITRNEMLTPPLQEN